MDFPLHSIKNLLYLLLLGIATFIIASYFSHNPQSYWFILTALLLSLITLGDIFLQRISIVLATGIIAALVVFTAGFLTRWLYLIAVYLLLITTVIAWLMQSHRKYFLPLLIINLCAILASTTLLTIPLNVDRALYILAGTVLVGVLQLIFAFRYKHNEMYAGLKAALISLKQMNAELFSCFLQADYSKNFYLYERRFHVQKYKFMQALFKLRALPDSNEVVLRKLENVFDLIMDCAQLRRRVSDYTIFDVCRDELESISQAIEANFTAMLRNKNGDNHLSQCTKRLEEVYVNVLQVTAKEPLVFLLFIASLMALEEAMEALNGAIKEEMYGLIPPPPRT